MPDAKGPAGYAGARGLAARHPLAVFLVLVFGAGWPILAVPVLADRGLLGGLQVPPEFFALAVTWLVMLPAALWITAARGGRQAVRDLLSQVLRWRLGFWWAVVLLALPATTLLVGLALGGSLDTTGARSTLLGGVLSLLTAVLVIHLAEEMVWAGFLQTRLENRHNLVLAALITSVPFSAIHLPLLLVGERSGLLVLVGSAKLLLLGIGMRLMLGVFLRGTGSVLAVGLLHGVFNASNNRGGLVDGFLRDADQNLAAPIAMVIVTALVAAVVARQSHRERHSNPTTAPASAGVKAASVAQRGARPEAVAGAVPHALWRTPTEASDSGDGPGTRRDGRHPHSDRHRDGAGDRTQQGRKLK